MTLADIIDRVRTNTHDKDVLEYEDTTITDYINDGIRFVRRTILSIDALQLLDDIVTGTLPAGEAIIQQDMRSSAVLEVRINGKRIDRISPWGIYDTREQGVPQGVRAVFLDYFQRIYAVAERFGHLSSLFVADETVNEHVVERHFARMRQSGENHSGNPEEDDIVTGNEHVGGIEVFEIFGLFGITERRERPERGGEPRVQNVLVLL